jgi:rod shape-determining protein MreC
VHYVSVDPPPFFHRGPSPLARLAFFGVISLALLFADTRLHYLERVRYVASAVLYPLQRAAQLPGEAIGAVAEYFTSLSALRAENEALKRQLVEAAPKAQGYELAEQQRARLGALLDVRTRYPQSATAVTVLYTGRDPFSQKLFIDKGGDAGIAAGEAVIDARGVVGQVTRVYPYMSEVTLLTDKDHAVPVKSERSGVRSVMFGAGAGRPPELRFLAPTADIQVGDVLVTSGLDGTYPPGLAVAKVATLDRDTGQMFARVTCAPLAGVDRSEQLLVLGRTAALPARPEEPVESETRKLGKGKGRRG